MNRRRKCRFGSLPGRKRRSLGMKLFKLSTMKTTLINGARKLDIRSLNPIGISRCHDRLRRPKRRLECLSAFRVCDRKLHSRKSESETIFYAKTIFGQLPKTEICTTADHYRDSKPSPKTFSAFDRISDAIIAGPWPNSIVITS